MDSQTGQHFRGQVGLKPLLNFLPLRVARLRSRPLDWYRSQAAAPTHSLLSCQVWPACQEEGQTAHKGVPSSSCVNNLFLDRSSRHTHTSSFLAKHQRSLSTQGDNDAAAAFASCSPNLALAPCTITIIFSPVEASTRMVAMPVLTSSSTPRCFMFTFCCTRFALYAFPCSSPPTFATMVVAAPSLAAITHWFAPFPPKPIRNSDPKMVSPGLGNLSLTATRSLKMEEMNTMEPFSCSAIALPQLCISPHACGCRYIHCPM